MVLSLQLQKEDKIYIILFFLAEGADLLLVMSTKTNEVKLKIFRSPRVKNYIDKKRLFTTQASKKHADADNICNSSTHCTLNL